MKEILILLLCSFLVNAELSEEFRAKMRAKVLDIEAKCATEVGASEGDIAELVQRKLPTRREGKCMLACMNHAFGAQDEYGKITEETILAHLEPYRLEDVVIFEKLKMILIDGCLQEVTSSDSCEAAAELEKCYHNKADQDLQSADDIYYI